MTRPAARTSARRSRPSRVSARAKVAVCPLSTSMPARRSSRPKRVTLASSTWPSTGAGPKGVSTWSVAGACSGGSNGIEFCKTLLADMKRFECSAILFDLDGVLVDSAAHVERQWRRWASARGLRPEPFLRVCHGRRALETIRMAAPELDAEAEVRALVPVEDEGAEAIGPLAGAGRLLGVLPLGSWAVATSGLRPIATSRLRRAGLPVPPVLVCAEDVARGKPSPDAYLLAARELGVLPSACL